MVCSMEVSPEALTGRNTGFDQVALSVSPEVFGTEVVQQLQLWLRWHILVAAALLIHRLLIASVAPAKPAKPSSVLGYKDTALNRCRPVLFICGTGVNVFGYEINAHSSNFPPTKIMGRYD